MRPVWESKQMDYVVDHLLCGSTGETAIHLINFSKEYLKQTTGTKLNLCLWDEFIFGSAAETLAV